MFIRASFASLAFRPRRCVGRLCGVFTQLPCAFLLRLGLGGGFGLGLDARGLGLCVGCGFRLRPGFNGG